MLKKNILMYALVGFLFWSCSSSDDDKDMEKPVIDMNESGAFPLTCDVVYKGESFTFKAIFTDNQELGSYNIEIHNNFDHHSHSTDDVECDLDEKKKPVNPFIYNKDFRIPDGLVFYEADNKISVPSDVDSGDYHFMIRLTDKSGWQQLKAVSIKIRERS